MLEKQPTEEANEQPSPSVKVFDKEVISKEDYPAIKSRLAVLMSEPDPSKKTESIYEAVESMVTLKQGGIKIELNDYVKNKITGVLPELAEKDPAALARCLNAIQHLGIVKNEDINESYKERLQEHLEERMSSINNEALGTEKDNSKGFAELCLNMKAIGLSIPDKAKHIVERQVHEMIYQFHENNREHKKSDVLEISKQLVQLQHLDETPSERNKTTRDVAHSMMHLQVSKNLEEYNNSGNWKDYAKLLAIFGMYKSDIGDIEIPLSEEVEHKLVNHTQEVKEKDTLSDLGKYVSHLRRIESVVESIRERISQRKPAPIAVEANAELVDEPAPEKKFKIENEYQEFRELMKEVAERGRIAVHSSWPGDTLGQKVANLSNVFDSRGTKELNNDIISQAQQNSIVGPIANLVSKLKIPEVIRMDKVVKEKGPTRGKQMTMDEFTGKPEDAGEPAIKITYVIHSSPKRRFSDHTQRTNNMLATMILPEKIGRQIYKQIERRPERIREILKAFDKKVIKAASKSMPNIQHEFLRKLNLPVDESQMLVVPMENEEDVLIGPKGNRELNPKYIKDVNFRNTEEDEY